LVSRTSNNGMKFICSNDGIKVYQTFDFKVYQRVKRFIIKIKDTKLAN